MWSSARLFVMLLIVACGCTAGMRPPEEPELAFAGPIRSRDVGEGGRVYIDLCSACHRGRVNPRGYRWTPAQMRHQIRHGNQIMPPLPEELISDEQVEAVLAYLVVSGALEGELPPEPTPDPIDTEPDDPFAAADELEEETDVAAAPPADEPTDPPSASEPPATDPEAESAQNLDAPAD